MNAELRHATVLPPDLDAAEQQLLLHVFSDAAIELPPPGTPADEFDPAFEGSCWAWPRL